ncbi:MAG TPA: metallophosphoesterase [Bryobacteraceae bacterium]
MRGISLDLIAALIFAIAHCRLAVLVLRWARRARVNRWAFVAAFVGFELVLAVGFLANYSPFGYSMPSRGMAIFGAISYQCLFATSCAVVVHAFLAPARFASASRKVNGGGNLSRRHALSLAGKALVAAPFAALGYGALVERTNFQVNETDIPLAGLPPDLDGLRILLLSDIHLGMFLSERELARMIDAACELHPQIAFATGDFITTFGDPLEASIRQVARVEADAGTLGCLGNHERYAHAEDEATRLAARAGIPVLRGESRQLRFGNALLNVAGVDYQRRSHWRGQPQAYLAGAESLIQPGAFNLLLSHNPDVFPVAARQGWSLVLAGHTHGGQVNVEILDRYISPAAFLTPYVRGLYRIGASAEYVTRGIGTVGIPARLGAPPEISLLTLRKA